MKKIIVISGKQYSGKDTLAKILLDKLDGFKRIGIGDAIKLEFCSKNSLSLEEVETNKHLYRNELIKLGNWGRGISDTYWLNKLSDMDKIIVPDIRVKFEADYFRKNGAFLVRINSDFENRSKRGIIVNNDDLTETQLDDYDNWNIIIENNSDYSALETAAVGVVNKFYEFINY